MTKLIKSSCLLGVFVLLSACTRVPDGNVVHNKNTHLAKGLVTQKFSESLSRGDRSRALVAEYKALESSKPGEQIAWQGRTADVTGTVVANQPYRVGSQDCRSYAHTIIISGEQATARGAACRETDGSWTLL